MFGICPHSGETFGKPPCLETIQDTADLKCRIAASIGELSDARAGLLVTQLTTDPGALGKGCYGTGLTGFQGASDICRDTHTRVSLLPVNLHLIGNNDVTRRGFVEGDEGVLSPQQIKKIHFTYLICSWQQKRVAFRKRSLREKENTQLV